MYRRHVTELLTRETVIEFSRRESIRLCAVSHSAGYKSGATEFYTVVPSVWGPAVSHPSGPEHFCVSYRFAGAGVTVCEVGPGLWRSVW